ncbi:MAG: adenylate/guanylate cyclase domain-containing protein [Pseudodonghicola sp.]
MPRHLPSWLLTAAQAMTTLGVRAEAPWQRRAQITINVSAYAVAVSTLVYAIIYALYDYETLRGLVIANLVMACAMPIIPFLHRWQELVSGTALLAVVYGGMFYIIADLGRDAGVQTNYIAGAAICTLIYSARHRLLGMIYAILSFALNLACWAWLPSDPQMVAEHPFLYLSAYSFTQISAVGIVALTLYYMMNVAARAETASSRLVDNMLPPTIAERLKSGHHEPIAENHTDVTVLIADLADFTAYAHDHAPEQVVSLLNSLFATYDALARQHRLEKIKTIGDGYLAAAGLLDKIPEPTARALRMGQDMIAATALIAAHAGIGLRVGLHVGPVTSGVIGTSKFAFDIWGDTVNTAFRLQECAPKNRVQLSDQARRCLGGTVPLTPRGPLQIRGIGRVEAWLAPELKRRRPPAGRLSPG